MATCNISKELVVTLKYFYEINISVVNTNRVEMFAVNRISSIKKVFLKFSQKSQENTCAGVSLWSVRQEAWNFTKKETSPQMLFFL